MAFSGDLVDFPLPELLFFLSSSRRSGWLTLRHELIEITFSLLRGQPIAAHSTAADQRLGARLVASGLVTRAQLDRALAHQALHHPTPTLGALLVKLGILEQTHVRQAVYAQLSALLVQMLAQPYGCFCFTRGLPDAPDVDLDLNLEREVLAAIGRAEEQFAAQLPTAWLLLARDATPERLLGAVAEDWPLFEAMLDGATSFADLVRASGWSDKDVATGLARLHAQGVVGIEPSVPKLLTADVESDRLHSAVRQFDVDPHAAGPAQGSRPL